MTRAFQRRKENFNCSQCGGEVVGDGYTNHCPHCLWSKHVDINPGDRSAECQGAMEPARVRRKHGEFIITHRCTACGFERNQRAHGEDAKDELIRLFARTNQHLS